MQHILCRVISVHIELALEEKTTWTVFCLVFPLAEQRNQENAFKANARKALKKLKITYFIKTSQSQTLYGMMYLVQVCKQICTPAQC